MKDSILKVQDLWVRYDRSDPVVEAVKGLDFSLGGSETLGLIGESGCGKTSVALAMCGLHTQASAAGCIEFDGVRLDKLTEREWKTYRSRRIGLVFQNTLEALNPVMTVGDQVAEPVLTHMDCSRGRARARVEELFGLVGLDAAWRDAYPHQLSGGMRQRVLLAMALSCDPRILIVDEPTTSLDSDSRAAILSLLKQLQKRLGFAMLFISHDLAAISETCSRVMVQYQGRILESGLARDILADPRHPYTRGLVNSSPSLLPYRDLWGIPGSSSSAAENGCPFYPRCCQAEDICRTSVPELAYVGVERRVACHKGGVETLLKSSGLNKAFTRPDGVVMNAVTNAGLEVRNGEVVALVGASGSGKSTLAHMLAGISTPDQGEILFKRKKVGPYEVGRRPGGVQLVFQDPFSATSPRLSVMECVAEPLRIMGKKAGISQRTDDIARAVRRVLEMAGLPVDDSFMRRRCHALSGGQRQRVAFARALVAEPALVIADEITSMLDPSTRANLIREIKRLQNEQGFAMLFITHDLDLARKIADRVAVMKDGRIVDFGAAYDLFTERGKIRVTQS